MADPADRAETPADGESPGLLPPPRGVDLARAALAAAREANAQRRQAAGRTPMVRRGGAAGLRRRRWSGPGPDARDPQPLAATMRTWVRTAGTGADLTKAMLFGRWAEIVGPEVADHCVPVSLVDGALTVQAESTAWATQIRMMAGPIVKRINDQMGDRSVKRLTARGPSGPTWRFGQRHVPGRGPRDTYG